MPNFSGIWSTTQQLQAVGQCNVWPSKPGQPYINYLQATVGPGANVYFCAPGCKGTYPSGISSYRAISIPGNITASNTTSPISVSGLTLGTSYSFEVQAIGSNGLPGCYSGTSCLSVTAATLASAPTCITVSLCGSRFVKVGFTAPTSNGGSAITSYTATSNTGSYTGANSASPIIVGVGATGNYNFKVKATNSLGCGPCSASSNNISIKVSCAIYIGTCFATASAYTWVAPAGVTSVAVVAIGGGAGSCSAPGSGVGGGGGGLSYTNNYSVTPGNSYNLQVGGPGFNPCAPYPFPAKPSWFVSACVLQGGAGVRVCGGASTGTSRTGGGAGGKGGNSVGGGGGAGGYSGNGGAGGNPGSNGSNGCGGGGGGGAGSNAARTGAGGGGGVGIFGQGCSGTGGVGQTSPGTGGSYNVHAASSSGTNYNYGIYGSGLSGTVGKYSPTSAGFGGCGGIFGGGGGGSSYTSRGYVSAGGPGAVRIVWAVSGSRGTPSFPSTNVGP